MVAEPYIFPSAQADYLRALRRGRASAVPSAAGGPHGVSLVTKMPPVYQQALRGTCVANAVTALLEYYGDCRTRLSVQFLYTATKDLERRGVESNLAHLRAGEALDPAFEAVHHTQILQLKMLAAANGGMSAAPVRAYEQRFEESVRTRGALEEGCLLRSCFKIVETMGTCRYALWPYAAARVEPLLGASSPAFPPNSREDALKRRVTSGLYLLGAPNNVEEIRAILAGENGRRPMPVAVTVHFFAGCDGATYALPPADEMADGRLASRAAWQGVHGILLVGYQDDPALPGGGAFIFRNSLGPEWGDRGYGRLPYAYLECFAVEAGTILQDMVDYVGDGYGGRREVTAPRPTMSFGRKCALNLACGIVVAAITVLIGVYFDDPLGLRPRKAAPVPVHSSGAEPAGLTGSVPDHAEAREEPVCYKVFFACASSNECRRLRFAFASEDVPYSVEFLPQTLATVLALRVTLPSEDIAAELGRVLKKSFPREAWADVTGQLKARRIYAVRETLKRWQGGL